MSTADDINYIQRRSLRLRDYDYSQPGAYFVTLCTQDGQTLFGLVSNGQVVLNSAGATVQSWWADIAKRFPPVEVDSFIVMPNHLHGILSLHDHDMPSNPVGADRRVGPPGEVLNMHTVPALSRVVQWFKTMTTNEYMRNVKANGWSPFKDHLWQRSYYEHVIRDEKDLDSIRCYITDNPAGWDTDEENLRLGEK